jgi:phage terminase small subunit
MGLSDLLRWQWNGYARNHRARQNLLLHIVVAPLFPASNVLMIWALVEGAWLAAAGAATITAISIAVQGIGHRLEELAPEPFTGPGNAIARILCEQWITFPRFVLSGGWWRALRAAP